MRWEPPWSRAEILLILVLIAVVANIVLTVITLCAPWVRRRVARLANESSSSPSPGRRPRCC
jgi:hypothetical protein